MENREKTPTAKNGDDNAESTKGHNEEEEGHLDNAFDQKRNKRQKKKLQGELKKIKPSMFEGESEEVVEAWMIDMGKYFQIYEYTKKLKARIAIYELRGKATLWWE